MRSLSRRAASIAASALAIGLGVAACGGSSKPAPATPAAGSGGASPTSASTSMSDAEFEASMSMQLAFIVGLGDSLARVGDADCAAIAKTIDAEVAAHPDALEGAARVDADPVLKARADGWIHDHQAELDAAATKIGAAVGPCTDDPAVQAAAAKLAPS